jgi:hypothetical protein
MESCGNQEILIASIKLAWYYSIRLWVKKQGMFIWVHVSLLRGRNETHVGLLAMSLTWGCQWHVKSNLLLCFQNTHTHTHTHISMSFIYQMKHIKTLSFIIINSFTKKFLIKHVWAFDWSTKKSVFQRFLKFWNWDALFTSP